MKKSTILVVILVYIVSFLVVGIFGISIRALDKDVYVDSITISVPEQGIKIEDKTDTTQVPTFDNPYLYKYNTDFKEGGITVQLKATVLPANTTFPNIQIAYNENQEVYSAEIVSVYYINVHFYSSGTAKLSVKSTDGKDYRVDVQIRAKLV